MTYGERIGQIQQHLLQRRIPPRRGFVLQRRFGCRGQRLAYRPQLYVGGLSGGDGLWTTATNWNNVAIPGAHSGGLLGYVGHGPTVDLGRRRRCDGGGAHLQREPQQHSNITGVSGRG